mgnify:FL=1
MFASIRYYKTTNAREVIRQVNEGFLPMISQAPGFAAYYLVNAGKGVMISVSIFDTKAGAEQSNHLAAGWVRQSVEPMLEGAPDIHVGEVVVRRAK